jgi:hypothetical protein
LRNRHKVRDLPGPSLTAPNQAGTANSKSAASTLQIYRNSFLQNTKATVRQKCVSGANPEFHSVRPVSKVRSNFAKQLVALFCFAAYAIQ